MLRYLFDVFTQLRREEGNIANDNHITAGRVGVVALWGAETDAETLLRC